MYYTESTGENFPLPKRFTRHMQFDGGPKLLRFEAEYTSYEHYTPSPAEFDTLKLYGLPLPFAPYYALEEPPEDAVAARAPWAPGPFVALAWGMLAIAASMAALLWRHKKSPAGSC